MYIFVLREIKRSPSTSEAVGSGRIVSSKAKWVVFGAVTATDLFLL